MDLIDAKILRLLQWNPMNPVDAERGPCGVWDVARVLDMHGNSVKRRIKSMVDEGVLIGFTLFPEASAMGLSVAYYAFQFDDDALCDRATDQVFESNPPGEAMRTADRELCFNLVVPYGEDLHAAAEAFMVESGAISCRKITPRNWSPDAPTDLEMRVLQQMHRDVMATPPEIAEAVGVTAKTVRKCVESLREKRLFCLCALGDYTKAAGLVASAIEVEVEDDSRVRESVLRAFPDIISEGVWLGTYHTFSVFAQNQQDLGHLMAEMRSVPGVKNVRLVVPLRMHFQALPEGLENVVERLVNAPLPLPTSN